MAGTGGGGWPEGETEQLLAKGTTRIYFQANVWIFTVLVFLLGTAWGMGMAAVS